MDDAQKLLKTIINHQSSVKQELLKEIRDLKKNLMDRVEGLEGRMDKGFRDVNRRVDMIGRQLAVLDEDAPTREEFDELKTKFEKISKKFIATA